uniref:SH3 domain containing 19 n=1 Tax=Salvator merianae TaxID=96440 RepID=A0A8D0B032_SALMN
MLFSRRPEITIVAAEPLGPSSWFPGGNHIRQQGLVFQSSRTQPPWRTNELVPAEPPSYEQVIKEINQVQVNTTSNNHAPSATHSRCTATSSTQTDFPEEIISNLPGINVKSNLHTLCEYKNSAAVQIPRKPPRPSSSLLNSNPTKNEELLVALNEQTCQEKPNIVIYPVPRPRSKSSLKPVVRDLQNNTKDNQEETRRSKTEDNSSSIHLGSLLDDNLWNSSTDLDGMDTDKSQGSIESRIKAFESQANTEPLGSAKKPEISPRSLGPKPVISAKKPVVAPKPGASRTAREGDSWTESKLKTPSQERHHKPQESGNTTNKPELPKKPASGIVKSSSNGLLNVVSQSASENNDRQGKTPIPAPRPLVPKKSVSFESPALPMVPLKPINVAPRLSVAAQSSAFRSLAEPPVASPVQSTASGEGDLISFDDDFLPLNSDETVPVITQPESDFMSFPPKNESAKDQTIQPAIARKPTVIRIPAKPSKALNEVSESPPPLPTEKPIGNTSGISAGKLSNIPTAKKAESENSGLKQSFKNEPVMPPRPSDGKVMPARPPPPKNVPGRPPPPKSIKVSSPVDSCSRSPSDGFLHKKAGHSHSGIKRSKSDVKNPDPALPPRPKPGHPLYNKYMVPVSSGIAKEEIFPQNTTRLSCKDSETMQKISDSGVSYAVVLHDFLAEHTDDLGLVSGETVYLLEKIDDEWYRGKCKNRTGIFPASFVKVIVDIPGEINSKKVHFSASSIVGPRCIARFEYIGDQKDELSFSEGEIIILKEYVNEEWAKGELKGTSGIFPLNFVEIVEDLPESGGGAALKNKNSASVPQQDRQVEQWCDAVHDFIAETEEDLSLKKGDRILILDRVNAEWYRGRLNGNEGIFPAAFVRVHSGETQSLQPPGGKKGKAKALYDFHAENIDELSFKVGDIITEVEIVDEEWMSGELCGKYGLFPQNFVQIVQPS